jgi:hypothetical protein
MLTSLDFSSLKMAHCSVETDELTREGAPEHGGGCRSGQAGTIWQTALPSVLHTC